MTVVYESETFRPAHGRVLAGVTIAICAAAAASAVASGIESMWRTGPWLLLVAAGAWALFWRPCVVLDAGGVTLVNVIRTVTVTWPAIVDIDTRWALELRTAKGRFRAWAAPAPSPRTLRRMTAEHRVVPGRKTDRWGRLSDLPLTDSGGAALLVRQRWERLSHGGHLGGEVEFDHVTRWHVATLVALVVLASASIVTVVL